MKEISFREATPFFDECIGGKGVFLTVGGKRPNTMTISWGWQGYAWGFPQLVVMVRPQRFTHDRIVEAREFTVSVPLPGSMEKELTFAGTKSGRDVDKFKGFGLTAVPGLKVAAPVVEECALHFECVVKHSLKLEKSGMFPAVAAEVYPKDDFHTLFFGEVVACYRTDK